MERVRFYAGPDIQYGRGWLVWLMLFPRRDLMKRHEEGYMILCGLGLELRLRPRRPFIRFDCWSDVDEITTRIASNAPTTS